MSQAVNPCLTDPNVPLSYLPLLSLLLTSCVVEIHDASLEIPVRDPFDRVVVDLPAGDVTLTGEGTGDVTVTADLTWVGADCPTVEARVRDDTLFVEGGCQEPALGWCTVDVQAALPAGLPVEVRTGSGDVVLTNLSPSIMETGSGDLVVEMRAHFEEIEGITGSGDVDLTVPAGTYRLDLDTGAGDVDIRRVSDDPQASSEIRVRTGCGDITVTGW